MIVFALLSLFSSVVSFTFGLTVHFLSKKNAVNLVFMLLCLSISYWAFTDFMVLQAETISSATFWLKAGFLWPFTSVFMFHFTMVFTNHKPLFGSKLTLILTYLPAMFFSVLHLATDLLAKVPLLKNGFYSYTVPEDSLLFWLSAFWFFMLSVIGLIILTHYYVKQTKKKRKQAQLVLLGFFSPVIISVVSEIFPYIFNAHVPDVSVLSTTILCVVVGVAIWKYGLFTLDVFAASSTIISTMPDSLILADSKSKILSINQRLVNLLGYSEKELVSKSVEILFEKEFASDILNQLSIKQEIKHHDVFCKTRAGKIVPVSVSASMIYDEFEVVGAVLVVRDITEKIKMEQLLLKSEKMAALGQAATMVGHDLRNPLQAIQNATYCIKTDLTRNSVGGSRFVSSFRMLEIIENAIAYSDNIVMDLKDFSTERKPEFRTTDVNELVESALDSCKIPETVKIEKMLGPPIFVNVDQAMMQRVFVNLLTNGCQAMPGGGTFAVSTVCAENFVSIQFQDTGAGMSKKTLQKLFTPFFTTKAQGMGMGLAICKKFIDLNGGSVEVTSKEGQGTTFTILLPVVSQKLRCKT